MADGESETPQSGQIEPGCRSKILVISHVDAVSAVLVSEDRDADIFLNLILNLDTLVLSGGDIRTEGEQEVAGHPLLNGNLRTRILISGQGIEGELRNS